MPTDRAQDTEAIRAALAWMRAIAAEPNHPLQREMWLIWSEVARLVARLEAAEQALEAIVALRLDENVSPDTAVRRGRIEMREIARAALAAAAPGETERTP